MKKSLEYKGALVGFIGALIIMSILNLLSMYALTFKIPQFIIGWISCLTYFALRDCAIDVKNDN